MERRSKAELMGQVLKQMALGRFEFRFEDGLETVLVKNYEPTFSEKEEALLDDLLSVKIELDMVEGTNSEWDQFEAEWTDWNTRALLRTLVRKDIGEEALSDLGLQGLGYSGVIAKLFELLRAGESPFGRELIGLREKLSSPVAEERERELMGILRGAVSDEIADHYAMRLAKRFPKMVGRLEMLTALPTGQRVPLEVQKYLAEATSCFIHGQYIACLLVCRSAIEFGLRHQLEKAGFQKEVALLGKMQRVGLGGLIELGKEKLPWVLGKTLGTAGVVKEEADAAVHRRVPSEEKCKQMFAVTRGVLRELFA